MAGSMLRALIFLVDTLISLYALVLVLRVLLQLVHANFYNPLSQFVWQATRAPVRWVGHLVPRRGRVDVPAIVLALVACYVNIELILALTAGLRGLGVGVTQLQPAAALIWAVLKAVVLVCNLYTFTLIIQAVMSWLVPDQRSPATALLSTLNEPLLRRVRGFVPPLGGVDLSPLVIIIALQVVSILLPLPAALH